MSNDKTKVQKKPKQRVKKLAKVISEIKTLSNLCHLLVTFKMPWQYYLLGAILWADGMLAGWLCFAQF